MSLSPLHASCAHAATPSFLPCKSIEHTGSPDAQVPTSLSKNWNTVSTLRKAFAFMSFTSIICVIERTDSTLYI
eukprot:5674657-Pyramimonas_sp.AAC.1